MVPFYSPSHPANNNLIKHYHISSLTVLLTKLSRSGKVISHISSIFIISTPSTLCLALPYLSQKVKKLSPRLLQGILHTTCCLVWLKFIYRPSNTFFRDDLFHLLLILGVTHVFMHFIFTQNPTLKMCFQKVLHHFFPIRCILTVWKFNHHHIDSSLLV